jgi:hypothetical protein
LEVVTFILHHKWGPSGPVFKYLEVCQLSEALVSGLIA